MSGFSPRAYQVYISGSTRRMLTLVAKTRGEDKTADQIADEALRAWVAAEHPKVSILIDEQDRLEKEFLKSVQPA